MDKNDYESKMETILNDEKTYEKTTRPLFKKIERQLNNKLLDLKNHDKLDETTYRRLRSTDGTLPTIRYSFKHHKEGNPLRPIVTCTNSTLYKTSRFLTEIFSPLQNKNGFSLKNSSQFSKEMANLSIGKDDVMVSFEVISLFIAIPVTKGCTYIKSKLKRDPTLPLQTNLTMDDIISLMEFILSNNYFVYKRDTYRQLHGCAIGSPVSPVVENLCMEEIKEEEINIAKVKPKGWKRYVVDGFCIIKSNAVASFHDNLNSIDPDINFTVEH